MSVVRKMRYISKHLPKYSSSMSLLRSSLTSANWIGKEPVRSIVIPIPGDGSNEETELENILFCNRDAEENEDKAGGVGRSR